MDAIVHMIPVESRRHGWTLTVVRVSWFEGKDHSQKEKVAAEITESIVRNTQTAPEYIYVIFEDVKATDWAGAGKLFGKGVSGSAT